MRLRLGGIGDALADRNFRIYTIGSITSWISFFRAGGSGLIDRVGADAFHHLARDHRACRAS